MTTISQLSKSLGDTREQQGLSVTDLATRSGVARAALYRFAADGDIRLTTFLAMADTLGLDVVLAPKAVSTSLQASVSSSPTVTANLSVQPQTGPMSAVEARMAAMKAKLKGGGGQ
jgi:predicted transcriptional regulator